MALPCLLLLIGMARDGNLPPDTVIRGASVYDGSGTPPRDVDVAIREGRIVAIGDVEPVAGATIIHARGLVLAPGFIDLHSHSDRAITREGTRNNTNYLLQGVTSVVTGNCGSGPVDVSKYLEEVDRNGAGTNVLHLIPHGSLRRQVLRDPNRPATDDEIAAMCKVVERGMNDGAWGMATGLIYVPGSFAETRELVELSKVVRRHHGIYASHMRNEGTRLLDSVAETLLIGQQAELPVHISHFKASGPAAWGLAAQAIRAIDEARSQGQRVTADQYPYVASSTSLAAMVIPDRYRGNDQFRKALEDPEQSQQLRAGIRAGLDSRGNGSRLVIASYSQNRQWQGKDLAGLAKHEGIDIVDLVVAIQQDGGASMVNFGMSEEEVRLIMKQPFVATASDGSARVPTTDDQPHPRNYGCFPRKIGHYAIDGQVLPLAQAIRSASGLPAEILQLPDRGFVRVGYVADLVVFDPKTFRDQATFEQPHQYSTGVRYLFVGGQLAVDDGKPTGTLAGGALRKNGDK